MSAVTLSTHLDRDVAERVRALAEAEHRTVSNLVAAAVAVFTDMPKPVRDALLEARSEADEAEARSLARAIEAAVARHRFDRAAEALARETRYDRHLADASELEALEAATRISTAEDAGRRR